MLSSLEPATPDAILGLTEAFKADPRTEKINLTTGVYKDEQGNTPVLESVHKAEALMVDRAASKSYLPIDGAAEYGAAVKGLLFEDGTADRAATAHTPGGTGALRVAGEFIHTILGGKTIWMSEPTWPNHPSIMKASGLEVKTYPYFDAATNSLKYEDMLGALEGVGEGEVVLLHGCCHNPTGIDPTPEQWAGIADAIAARGALPLVDFAYQGFADGIQEDAAGMRTIAAKCPELFVCTSYSKNFGLYSERVGALTLVGETADAAKTAMGHVKTCIRSNYSNPPMHGAMIVTTILGDEALRAEWEVELKEMRDRINGMRQLFVDTLHSKNVGRDFSFMTAQRGMFSFSGLTPEQVDRLKDEFGIYLVRSGRINVAGITPSNVDTLCDAIAAVL